MSATDTAVVAYCGSCGEGAIPADRFCSRCGASITEDVAAARAASAPPETPAFSPAPEPTASAAPLHPGRLLVSQTTFCRACGADQAAGTGPCTACGVTTAPPPSRLDGDLGSMYMIRRKIRKRPALLTGSTGEMATLLLESGESLEIARAELPPATKLDLPDGPAVGTPHGTLLKLVNALHDGTTKRQWAPDALVDAALANIDGTEVARAVAVDALRLGRSDLLERLHLTAAERDWLSTVDAVARGDVARAVDAIGRLPTTGYRQKLTLIACVASAARDLDANVAALAPHLAHFAGEEPLADLLQRQLDLKPGGERDAAPAAVAATGRRIVDLAPLQEDLAVELRCGLDALDGDSTGLGRSPRFLDSGARIAIALQAPSPNLLRPEDVTAASVPLLDDLIERGALTRDVALAAATAPATERYLRARLAPDTLADGDAEQLGHRDELARRAFCRDNGAQIGADDHDSPSVRHYRTLDAIRRKRLAGIVVEDAHESARPAVAALRDIVAQAEGTPVSEDMVEPVLADPTAWPVLVDVVGPSGLELSAGFRARFPRFGEWLALHQAREHLFTGNWTAAIAAADDCLALAEDEAIRDEALNLKACGLYYSGDSAGAIAALEEAIEGAYSDALLANIGIAAAELRPEVAARHLGVLIAEAPTIAMRVAAAHRALDLWSASDRESWQNSDDSPLPDAFQDALRALVVDDLDVDDFRAFVSLLAIHDAAWLRDEASLRGSPLRGTLPARFYVARATSLLDVINVMGPAMARGEAPQWLLDERESLRSAAVEILFDNLDEPDSTFGSVAIAMVDKGVLENLYDELLLHALGIASLAYHLTEQQSEVSDEFAGRVHRVRDDRQRLDDEDRGRLEPIVELATRRVAINRMRARDRDLSEAIDVFNDALERGRYAAPGTTAYANAMGQIDAIAQLARSIREDVLQWLPIVDHSDVRADLDKTVELTRELEGRCLRILG